MTNRSKIIDKICKCLRLAESSNANEAALALKQAQQLMQKYGVTDVQVQTAAVEEGVTSAGDRYNPPFWALALSNLVAEAFHCRSLVSRKYGRKPEFRFIGIGYKAEVATYTYAVLHRYLSAAIEEFEAILAGSEGSDEDKARRTEVFAQAWLFRVGRTVAEFVDNPADKAIIDEYIEEKYGDTPELAGEPVDTIQADYEDILTGMRAGNEVELYRSMSRFFEPRVLQHKQVS